MGSEMCIRDRSKSDLLISAAAALLALTAAISGAWEAVALAQRYRPGGWVEGDAETNGVQGFSHSEAKCSFIH